MKRGFILPPKQGLIIPENVRTPPDPNMRPGRVTMGIGGETCVADLCSALSIASKKIGDEDALIIALRAPTHPLALYQPFDMAEAREFAAALLQACDAIEEAAAAQPKQERDDA